MSKIERCEFCWGAHRTGDHFLVRLRAGEEISEEEEMEYELWSARRELMENSGDEQEPELVAEPRWFCDLCNRDEDFCGCMCPDCGEAWRDCEGYCRDLGAD